MSRDKMMSDRFKRSLNELEGEAWSPPEYDSHLVRTCHQLRTKPIGDFTAEDLRIMIGQEIGLFFLVPLALQMLEPDIAVSGAFFPGDLLEAVLRVPEDYWLRQQEQRDRLRMITENTQGLSQETIGTIERWRTGTA